MKQVTEKHVAIIILNWNAYDDTFECLKSLEHLTYPYFHVFLVDNASQDGSFNKLQQDYNEGKLQLDITFIQTGKNLGFAGGNNVAIKKAYEQGYQYFWMLNNDTVVDPNALTSLVEVLEKEEKVGIVGSKIYYYGTNKIWFAGGKVNTWTGKTKHIGIKEEDIGQYNRQIEVDYITGCSLCFRKEVVEDIGYMLEDYFLYFEETDWNIRASQNNWYVKFVPHSIVFHKISASSGGEMNPAPYVGYYNIRNSLVFIKRTQPNYKLLVAFVYSVWKIIKKVMKMFIINQNSKKERFLLLIKGLIDGLTNKMGKI
ncbi:glycosyltransferase family 2 protein [Geobacillus thermodenitrificans subsp. calidus]